jgi:hypothetical protein
VKLPLQCATSMRGKQRSRERTRDTQCQDSR